jgi:hypothetical protein
MEKHVEAGGQHFTFHDLRSVSADWAETVEEARDRLGHTSFVDDVAALSAWSSASEAAALNIRHSRIYQTDAACKLARPERFELPTFWFVGCATISGLFEINNLDCPPSPIFTPRLAKSR